MKTYEESLKDLAISEKNRGRLVTLNGEQSDDEFLDMVDAIVEEPKKNQKTYVIVKGSDTLPASIDEIARLSYIKRRNELKSHKNYGYAIFCERKGNGRTEDIAKNFDITYISRDVDRDNKMNDCFSGR